MIVTSEHDFGHIRETEAMYLSCHRDMGQWEGSISPEAAGRTTCQRPGGY
jgi:hypothetical protein